MSRTDRIAEPWGTPTPYGPGEDLPVRVDMHLQEGLEVQDVDRWGPNGFDRAFKWRRHWHRR
jgi:hypothetical protein